jgi:phosphatidylserine/phosphatidylglycerophosphate/cardiolipin synthase-like enzyme
MTWHDVLIDTISRAERQVFLASPTVEEDCLADAVSAARARGVAVRMLTEVRKNRGDKVRIPTWGLDGEIGGTELARHFAGIRRLARMGVQLRALDHFCHLKLWMADGAHAVAGSANLTANALGTGQSPSLEVMQEFEGAAARGLQAIGDHLWQLSPWRLHAVADGATRVQEQRVNPHPPPMFAGMALGVPGHDNPILRTWLQAIERARRSVFLFTYSAFQWGAIPRLVDVVASALGRGVRVELAYRPGRACRQGDDGALVALVDQGLQLLPIGGLHAKGLIVDRSWVGLTSGNLTPHSLAGSSESDNVELAVWGREPEMLDSRRQLESMVNHCPQAE